MEWNGLYSAENIITNLKSLHEKECRTSALFYNFAPHSGQNFACEDTGVPQLVQKRPAAAVEDLTDELCATSSAIARALSSRFDCSTIPQI